MEDDQVADPEARVALEADIEAKRKAAITTVLKTFLDNIKLGWGDRYTPHLIRLQCEEDKNKQTKVCNNKKQSRKNNI